jgi:hypothetical protein
MDPLRIWVIFDENRLRKPGVSQFETKPITPGWISHLGNPAPYFLDSN